MSELIADNAARSCAAEVMATLPLIMRTIGAEMHRRHAGDLSAPQFHALNVVDKHDGASLSFLARHIASGLPSASKLVDGLVERGLVARAIAPDDRRRVLLSLTPRGRELLHAFHQEGVAYLATHLASLTDDEQRAILHAMGILRRRFALNGDAACPGAPHGGHHDR
ncbi:MAG TPA: MarR family transcriptional regulator [Armatimonadota bacterium]|nr:MarR family transcriptional regulator [Armatimonadota bacterium]HOS42134.1 MarR family transcriptional regulator [Armatimonadota bacterium]